MLNCGPSKTSVLCAHSPRQLAIAGPAQLPHGSSAWYSGVLCERGSTLSTGMHSFQANYCPTSSCLTPLDPTLLFRLLSVFGCIPGCDQTKSNQCNSGVIHIKPHIDDMLCSLTHIEDMLCSTKTTHAMQSVWAHVHSLLSAKPAGTDAFPQTLSHLHAGYAVAGLLLLCSHHGLLYLCLLVSCCCCCCCIPGCYLRHLVPPIVQLLPQSSKALRLRHPHMQPLLCAGVREGNL